MPPSSSSSSPGLQGLSLLHLVRLESSAQEVGQGAHFRLTSSPGQVEVLLHPSSWQGSAGVGVGEERVMKC